MKQICFVSTNFRKCVEMCEEFLYVLILVRFLQVENCVPTNLEILNNFEGALVFYEAGGSRGQKEKKTTYSLNFSVIFSFYPCKIVLSYIYLMKEGINLVSVGTDEVGYADDLCGCLLPEALSQSLVAGFEITSGVLHSEFTCL